MAELTIAIVGLNRVSASLGLALRRYMTKGGKHKFRIIGHDVSTDAEKAAMKMAAVDTTETRLPDAVADADLVVLAWSYEEVDEMYRYLGQGMRDGAVLLDASPLKRASLDRAKKYLRDTHHLVGMTAILNPLYLFKPKENVEEAEEDLFDDSAILLTPSAGCAKEAVDLAFNFAQIVGSKPRFLDPYEHDTLLAQTNQLPAMMGVTLFYNLMNQGAWDDLKWFTNPAFGVLTRPLFDVHPDALRDEWYENRDVLTRALDDLMVTLQEARQILADGDKAAIEALLVSASEEYERWINHRYRADWDADSLPPEPKVANSFLSGLFGNVIADKLAGDKDKD